MSGTRAAVTTAECSRWCSQRCSGAGTAGICRDAQRGRLLRHGPRRRSSGHQRVAHACRRTRLSSRSTSVGRSRLSACRSQSSWRRSGAGTSITQRRPSTSRLRTRRFPSLELFPNPTLAWGRRSMCPASTRRPRYDLSLTQTILLGGKLHARTAVARDQSAAARAQLDDFLRTLRGTSATAYVDAVHAEQVYQRKRQTAGIWIGWCAQRATGQSGGYRRDRFRAVAGRCRAVSW